MDSVTGKLENLALVESSGFDVSGQSLKSARETMARGFGDLTAVYNNLVAKYTDICRRTNLQTLAGINDIPLGAPVANRGLEYSTVDDAAAKPGTRAQNADMRTIITQDLRSGNLAQHFALAEFALTNGLSDNICMGLNEHAGINFQLSGGKFPYAYFDEHNLGAFCQVLVSTFAHLCYGACLLELIDQLKAKNLFTETLIDLSGEMGRNPRNTLGGSDHGGQALDVAMWSGAFDPAGPKVVGDVLAQPPASYFYVDSGINVYAGSWGHGAPNDGVGILTHGHIAATQAHVMRTENPVRSVSSLLTETNGMFRSKLPLGRIK